MKIKYKITSYDDFVEPIEKASGELILDDKTNFIKAVNIIISKHNSSYLNKQIYIEDLVEKTWGKYFNEDFTFHHMQIDSFHYKWLNYSLEDIQKVFKLFNSEINIVVDGPGIGREIYRTEGIKFIIHSDEKSSHEKYPHIHAEYSGEKIFIYIKDGSLLNNKGFKNKKKTKIAINYVINNKENLLKQWNLIIGTNINVTIDI